MQWSRWFQILSYSRSSLWIVPFFAIVFQQVAIRLADRLEPLIPWSFYGIGLNGAQAVLNAIVSMILAFLVFTFGSLLVAIQIAGGQLTPRIIASMLLRNNVVRYSVGLFVFTLLYAMGALSRTESAVQQLHMAIAVVAGFGSIIAFLYLIDYAARLLRPVSILQLVGEAGLNVIEAVYRRRHERPRLAQPQKLPVRPRQVVYHKGTSGIVLAVNTAQLLTMAQERDCIVEFLPFVGDFVAVDEPLFQIYGGAAIDEERLRTAVALGTERTMEQDPIFAFRILVDIGIKALSKAINDPTTAVLAIDQLHRLLRKVGRRHTSNDQIVGADGKLRVVQRTPNWADFVATACAEIRFYGAENLQIARRLRAMLNNLIQTLPESRHGALRLELDLLDRTIDKIYAFPEDAAMARVADSQGLGASGTAGTV
jgi:uncharacterized membrane protein